MMAFGDASPKARHWAMPWMIAAVVGVLPWAATLTQQLSMVLLLVACVFFAWGLVNFGYHVAWIWGSVRDEARSTDYRFTQNYLADQILKMNDTQITALRAGQHLLDVYPGEDGPIEKLAGIDVYLFFAWHVLVHSGNEHVYAINSYSPETYHFDILGTHAVDDRQQARNFHTWLCSYGYAEWGRGNSSARWVKGFSPDAVLKRLGMDRDTYESDNGSQ